MVTWNWFIYDHWKHIQRFPYDECFLCVRHRSWNCIDPRWINIRTERRLNKNVTLYFLALLIGAVLFFILTVKWQSLSLGVLDIVLWFILSASVFTIELPYVAMQADNTIVEGVQIIESLHILSPLFMVIGIIVLIYWLTSIVFPMLSGKLNKMM